MRLAERNAGDPCGPRWATRWGPGAGSWEDRRSWHSPDNRAALRSRVRSHRGESVPRGGEALLRGNTGIDADPVYRTRVVAQLLG
jgi:hypothetical protein